MVTFFPGKYFKCQKVFIMRSLLTCFHNLSQLQFWLYTTDSRNNPSIWCFWIWHLTADTMVTMPNVRHEIVDFQMQQNWYIGFLGHSATSIPNHIFVYEEIVVCKIRWCKPLIIDGSQEIRKKMISYITQSLSRMLHSARANKTALITLNPKGNLHFIRWKRFEIVCCRRLKRGEIKREKETEAWIRNEIHDFSFWSTE